MKRHSWLYKRRRQLKELVENKPQKVIIEGNQGYQIGTLWKKYRANRAKVVEEYTAALAILAQQENVWSSPDPDPAVPSTSESGSTTTCKYRRIMQLL
ncbi:hypothetical protein niasHT_037580 [Heterodera trifolii]|uniref:Uncharacterized protein n=1 Tax=Heterodera trifolii TaxID=157864 RepID=A0ABD2IBW1_9BILA